MLPIRTIYQQNFKADYSGIKIKCGLHILRPRLEKKIVKMLKIGRVIAIFVGFTKILRIFKNIFFQTHYRTILWNNLSLVQSNFGLALTIGTASFM